MVKLLGARRQEYFVSAIAFHISFLAPVAAGKGLAVCIAKLCYESLVKIAYTGDRQFASLTFSIRYTGRIGAAEIPQIDCSADKDTICGFARSNSSTIAGGRPLIGNRAPITCFPQNLQDRFRSGIAFSHQLHAFVPKFF